MTRKKHITEFVDFQLTPQDKIRYTDADVQYLSRQADVAGGHLIDGTCWTRDGLLAIATCYPVLIRRSTASRGLYVLPFLGILDRIQPIKDGMETIDFKTGKPSDAHRTQHLRYALLWWRTTSEAPTRITAHHRAVPQRSRIVGCWDESV